MLLPQMRQLKTSSTLKDEALGQQEAAQAKVEQEMAIVVRSNYVTVELDRDHCTPSELDHLLHHCTERQP